MIDASEVVNPHQFGSDVADIWKSRFESRISFGLLFWLWWRFALSVHSLGFSNVTASDFGLVAWLSGDASENLLYVEESWWLFSVAKRFSRTILRYIWLMARAVRLSFVCDVIAAMAIFLRFHDDALYKSTFYLLTQPNSSRLRQFVLKFWAKIWRGSRGSCKSELYL